MIELFTAAAPISLRFWYYAGPCGMYPISDQAWICGEWMGVTFDRAVRISGYRPSIFKDALTGYLRTNSPSNLIDLRGVFPLRRDGAIIYEECVDRGLIDPTTHEVTERGLIVARAKVVTRTPLAKAKQVLNDFLERVDQLNSEPESISRVEEVWLFGSLMREEATVGDIDLAILGSRDPRFGRDLNAQVTQAKKLIAKFNDAPGYWASPWDRIDWLFRRAIFGARRHPLLAGAQEGINDLVSLGVPCRLIYNRSRGGRVNDRILLRHPDSPGRSNSLPPPPQLPDLTPAKLRPMDARWVAGFNRWGSVSPYEIFRGWTEECRKLFPRYPENLRIVADGHDLGQFPWTPRILKKKGLDGRSAVAIICATEWYGTCITLHRTIEDNPNNCVLCSSFSNLVLNRSRKYVDLATLPDMVAAVSLILAVDAERILRRAIEMDTLRHVTIHISTKNLPDDMRTCFAEQIAETLNGRAVSIEPPSEAASVRVELR